MASLGKKGDGWEVRFRDRAGKQAVVWLGAAITEDAARKLFDPIAKLIQAHLFDYAPDTAAALWASRQTGRLRKRLATLGLCDPERETVRSQSRAIGTLFRAYIDERKDWKFRTVNGYGQALGWFEKKFGKDKPISAVTPSDADRWIRWMAEEKQGLAAASISKHAKRIRSLYAFAIRDGMATSNPFTGMKLGEEVNRDRDFYVTREMITTVIAECDTEWALILSLVRFAGLRCPSEVLGLKWTDVLWDKGRIRIARAKTAERYVPIFPEIKPYLESAFEEASEGSVYCISRYRDKSNANLRSQLYRIIEEAGLVPWEKLFVNMRASARTDLEERFPHHVCNEWLGHSGKVASKHYLQVTQDHWDRAMVTPVVTSGAIREESESITDTANHQKIQEKTIDDGTRRSKQYPGRGSKKQRNFKGTGRVEPSHGNKIHSLVTELIPLLEAETRTEETQRLLDACRLLADAGVRS